MSRLSLAVLALCAGPALAAPEYLDDRSTPEAVIASLYNAVTLHDYPRAWSYFRDGERPDYAAFRDGYAATGEVEVRIGTVEAEGAAGTTYWRVPTVIEARAEDGTRTVYSGCYSLSQSNPGLRDAPPYDPIAIRDGTLRPDDRSFAEAEGHCD